MQVHRKIQFRMAWITVFVPFILLPVTGIALADVVPREAMRYQRDLIRSAHSIAGLNSPVAAFAAQIAQESGWNPKAVSIVGAQGMAQFMPATAQWWCDLNRLSATDCQPANPVWSMRALIGYDKWLYDRVKADTEFDRWWAALRAYNGGLGHWQKEAAAVHPSMDRVAIDSACGHALRTANYRPRSIKFCPENLGYPRRILIVLQPHYLSWGIGVSA